MDAVERVLEVDFVTLFLGILAVILALKVVVTAFEWVVNKFGIELKYQRKKKEDHNLLIETSNGLVELKKKHDEDSKALRDDINAFAKEIRDSILETQKQMGQFTDNRVHDREQSIDIQKKLVTSIDVISKDGQDRDSQINSLTDALRELLAEKINEKYKYYISINGIPEDEVDEFVNLHKAYNGCGGNHNGDAKYNYVMEHLQVIPVEVRLVEDSNKS